MAKKIALLFAGQGAQVVGMGKDLADQFPTVADLFRQADEILGRKLSEIVWSGPIEELTKTSNCQPALFVHGLACLAILRELVGEFPIEGAAGLSLGEMTAHAAAGTFDFVSGLKLVQCRSELMDEACEKTSGGNWPPTKTSMSQTSTRRGKSSFRVSWRKWRPRSAWQESTASGERRC